MDQSIGARLGEPVKFPRPFGGKGGAFGDDGMTLCVIGALAILEIIITTHDPRGQNGGIVILFVLEAMQTAQTASITQRFPLFMAKFTEFFCFPKGGKFFFHGDSVAWNYAA